MGMISRPDQHPVLNPMKSGFDREDEINMSVSAATLVLFVMLIQKKINK